MPTYRISGRVNVEVSWAVDEATAVLKVASPDGEVVMDFTDSLLDSIKESSEEYSEDFVTDVEAKDEEEAEQKVVDEYENARGWDIESSVDVEIDSIEVTINSIENISGEEDEEDFLE